jgi:ATP-binding cassette, subfamily B, multidrug efflux pump
MPAAMQWHGYKAVERQDLAFFHDLFAGQVASRISQLAAAVQQQIVVASSSIPYFLVQFLGSLSLLATLSWPLALPVFFWIVANVTVAVAAVPYFAVRSRHSARARSLVVGAMTDLYSNIHVVNLFVAEDSEADAMRTIMGDAIETQQLERLVAGFFTTGQFVASIALVQRLNANSLAFLQLGQQIFQAVGTIRDAMPVITMPSTVTDVSGARPLTATL